MRRALKMFAAIGMIGGFAGFVLGLFGMTYESTHSGRTSADTWTFLTVCLSSLSVSAIVWLLADIAESVGGRKVAAGVTACLLLLKLPAFSQEYPRAEIFGGYSYLNVDTNGLSSRLSAHGWEASTIGNVNKWLGAEGIVAGYYRSVLGVRVSDYAFLGGPRLTFRPAFIHAGFGFDHLAGAGSSQNSFAFAAGGGIEHRVSGPWGLRLGGDYVLTNHNIFGGAGVAQHNYRATAGIVYFLRPARASIASEAPGMPLPSLGIKVVLRENAGAEITEVLPGTVAALADLRIRDVINRIDGRPVATPMDLSMELSHKTAGSGVRLGYLVSGYYQTEKLITLH